MKALFLVLHRKNRSPGQRYRHEQYVDYLQENGIECHFSPLLPTQKDDLIFYGKKILPKIGVGLRALFRRWKSILKAGDYDVVYIYRDAFFFGTFFEKWLRKKQVRILYDFDDAIWLMDKNENQGIFNLLKNPQKTSTIISLSDLVIVGNEYLHSYARQFHANISIIPSTIDFSAYKTQKKRSQNQICIGWTGSFSTIKHFETIVPVLVQLRNQFKDYVTFKVIGDPTYIHEGLEVKGQPWNPNTEAEDLSEIDIGLMPLPDSSWTRGKCGMKGLQYMALGIPTVMSPVGVNSDIIQDGQNGFLASSTEEWIEKLSMLIENADLRKRIGEAGKKTALNHYSVEANKDKWLKAFS